MLKWIVGLIVLVVIGFVLVKPAFSGGCYSDNKAVNANNMKEICKTIHLHRSKTQQLFPNPWLVAGVEFPVVKNGHEAMLVTAIIFEYLSSVNDMYPEVFVNPHYDSRFDGGMVRRTAAEIVANPDLRYAEFYALDWCLDNTASSTIPMISDRFPAEGLVQVVYEDSGLAKSNKVIVGDITPKSMNRTIHGLQKKGRWSAMLNEDDIFSTNDRGPFLLGQKRSANVWMK
ncbi:MAG: hypothetical protein HRU15_03675 [Planctomycetes bacterium]|nr:hypothetical protein [Planctomycetota bacterium]